MRTDHDSLKWIVSLKNRTSRLARWRLWLFKFGLLVVHRTGVERHADDAMSRLQTTDGGDAPLKNYFHVLANDTKGDYSSKLVTNANSDDMIPLSAQEETLIHTPPTLEESIAKQTFDECYNAASFNAGHAGSDFKVDQRGFLLRKSVVSKPIQIVTPNSPQARIWYPQHHLLLPRHSALRRMYDTLRRTYYWAHIASIV